VTLPPAQVIAAPVVPAVLAAAGASAPTSDLVATVLPAINAISSATAAVNAVAQLAPSNSALGASQVTFEGDRAFQDLLSAHLREDVCGSGSQTDDRGRRDDQRKPDDESSSCPEGGPYNGLWVKGFGYFGDQGAQGALSGYMSRILGAMMGYDVALADDTRAGFGIGYAHSAIDGTVPGNTTGFDTRRATAYVAHEDGTWFADGNLSYGANSYSGERQIVFTSINRTALAKYSGDDATGFVTAGRHFLADDVTITPLVSLQATHLDMDGYTETGAGDIDLQVAPQHYNFLESGLGMNIAHQFDLDGDQALLPEAHFKWLHELLNQDVHDTAMFTATGSTPFVTTGLSTVPDTLNLGAGLTLLSCGCSEKVWSVEGIYDYYWRNQNYSAHQVTLAASYRF